MFSEKFLVFIFMMVMNLVIKSVKDKNEIEKKGIKKKIELGKVPNKSQGTIMPPKKRANLTINQKVDKADNEKINESQTGETKRTVDSRHLDEPLFQESKSSVIENKFEEKKIEKSNEQMRKDILRGIIYSEILSEPKSRRYRRKSM